MSAQHIFPIPLLVERQCSLAHLSFRIPPLFPDFVLGSRHEDNKGKSNHGGDHLCGGWYCHPGVWCFPWLDLIGEKSNRCNLTSIQTV